MTDGKQIQFYIIHGAALAVCVFMACSMLIRFIPSFLGHRAGEYLKYFTHFSNLLNGMTSVYGAGAEMLCLFRRKELSRTAVAVRFLGTVGTALTLLTVVCFLAPMNVSRGGSYWSSFEGSAFLVHLANPVLSLALLLFLTSPARRVGPEAAVGLLPVIFYGCQYAWKVMIRYVWADFYGFTFGYRKGIGWFSLLVLLLVAVGMTVALRIIVNDRWNRMFHTKKGRSEE